MGNIHPVDDKSWDLAIRISDKFIRQVVCQRNVHGMVFPPKKQGEKMDRVVKMTVHIQPTTIIMQCMCMTVF